MQTTNELIASIRDGRTRCTAANAAFLLGMTQEMPAPNPGETRQIRMAQAIHDANNGGRYPPPTPGSDANEPNTSCKSEPIFYSMNII